MNQSLRSHVDQKTLELGRWVMSRRRIYLDLCFWIRAREAKLARSTNAEDYALLALLTDAVSAGRVVCTISDMIFLELLRQSDPSTRAATADLVDQLGKGISLIPHRDRFAIEVQHFIYDRIGLNQPPLEECVWTKVGYVLGEIHPTGLPPELNEVETQKGFFDYMWSFPIAKLISVIGDREPPETFFEEQAKRLNRLNAEHSHEIKSFAQVYRDEVYGVLEEAAPIALNAIRALAPPHLKGAAVSPEHLNVARGVLRAAIAKREGRRALRTAHLGAAFHAAVRWNSGRQLTANDLPDLHHAQAGMGYCDAFFTDAPTRNLVQQNNLALAEDFGCEAFSTVSNAVRWLREQ